MSKRKGYPAPRTVTIGLRAKAWWVLRKNKSMTLAELMLTVCDGSEASPRVNLQRWLNRLCKVGFVRRELVKDGQPHSNGSYRYTLLKDPGPKPLVVRSLDKVVFDPNSGECFEIPPSRPFAKGGMDEGGVND